MPLSPTYVHQRHDLPANVQAGAALDVVVGQARVQQLLQLKAVDRLVLVGQLHEHRLVLALGRLRCVRLVAAERYHTAAGDGRKRIQQHHRLRLQLRQLDGVAEQAHSEAGLLARLVRGGHQQIAAGLQIAAIADVPRVAVVRIDEAHLRLEELLGQRLAEFVLNCGVYIPKAVLVELQFSLLGEYTHCYSIYTW